MYITTFTHFLDEKGNIPSDMPKEARELASFLALIVDEATKHYPEESWLTDIRCFNPDCDCETITEFIEDGKKLYWFCPECAIDGVISDWQGSRWVNTQGLTIKEKQLLEDFFNKSLSDDDKREFIERASTDRNFIRQFISQSG
jgi:hypothetical protein